MMAGADPELVAQPSPAKLEALGMETFVAAWPSHLAYSMIVGDVVAERVTRTLGAPGAFGAGPSPAELPRPAVETGWSRWHRPGFPWLDWTAFAGSLSYPAD